MQRTDFSQTHEQFAKHERQIRNGPVEDRSCQDICCCIIFFLLLFSFIGIGIYYIVVGYPVLNPNILKVIYSSQPLAVLGNLISKYWPIILGMFGLSLVLSLVFVCMIRFYTKCMVYTLFIVAVLIMGGIIAISAISLAWGTMIAASVGLLLYLCLICCFCKQIKRGIVMLKAAMQFLKNRPSVYLVPFYILVMGLCFLAFWFVTLICMQYIASANMASGWANTKQIVFFVFWLVMIVFMSIFFYYVMVFLVSYVCANWYYGNHEGCCRGIGLLNRAHIGSLTFASLFIVVVKIIQLMGSAAYRNSATNGNCCCITICLCCLSCCLAQIQYIVEVLNKYSAIGMALTGEGYINSAKTALSVIFKDFPLFYIVNGMSDLIKIGGVIFAAGIPTLLSFLLINVIYPYKINSYSYETTLFLLLVFLICFALSYYFVFLISIAQASVFFFYCLDRRYRDIGVTIPNTPSVIKQLETNPQFEMEYKNDYIPGSAERIR